MADLLSRSNQVQSTEWSLHPQVFKQICLRWFTPHVDLFATRLNHKVPLYVSPVPDPNAWDIDALNKNWSGLTAYAYRPTAPTNLLCYKLADQQALDMVQVKVHDIRAFAASKAFYGGLSVDQIMQACHWKAHNTFTNFYLKDLTWSDNDTNMYLGPVVASQQVLDPSPQHTHLREEKKEGAHPLQPSLQESIPGSRY